MQALLRLTENLLGFYDGREPRTAGEPIESWVDDGALSLGICSYALVDGGDAIVYDTHVSLERARAVRETIERLGARRIRVRSESLAPRSHRGKRGLRRLRDHREPGDRRAARRAPHRDRVGDVRGPAADRAARGADDPVRRRIALETEHNRIELVHLDIHSRDATVIRLPEAGLLLAGDTVEDTVTYIDEPDRLERHLDELERMRQLGARRILPNHGSRETIEHGGYAETLIDATEQYVRDLLRRAGEPIETQTDLRMFVADQLAAGVVDAVRRLPARPRGQRGGGREPRVAAVR